MEFYFGVKHLVKNGWPRVEIINSRPYLCGEKNCLENITNKKPCFGDHLLIMADCCTDRPEDKLIKKEIGVTIQKISYVKI